MMDQIKPVISKILAGAILLGLGALSAKYGLPVDKDICDRCPVAAAK